MSYTYTEAEVSAKGLVDTGGDGKFPLYGKQLANKGWEQACRDSLPLRLGLNLARGKVTCLPVAEAFGLEFLAPEKLLKI